MALKDIPVQELTEEQNAALKVRQAYKRHDLDILRADRQLERTLERLIKQHGKEVIANELGADKSEFLSKTSSITDKVESESKSD